MRSYLNLTMLSSAGHKRTQSTQKQTFGVFLRPWWLFYLLWYDCWSSDMKIALREKLQLFLWWHGTKFNTLDCPNFQGILYPPKVARLEILGSNRIKKIQISTQISLDFCSQGQPQLCRHLIFSSSTENAQDTFTPKTVDCYILCVISSWVLHRTICFTLLTLCVFTTPVKII